MFLDVYINGVKRSTIAASNEETMRTICAGMPEVKDLMFLPVGVTPESLKQKLQGVKLMQENATPQAKKGAKQTV